MLVYGEAYFLGGKSILETRKTKVKLTLNFTAAVLITFFNSR